MKPWTVLRKVRDARGKALHEAARGFAIAGELTSVGGQSAKIECVLEVKACRLDLGQVAAIQASRFVQLVTDVNTLWAALRCRSNGASGIQTLLTLS